MTRSVSLGRALALGVGLAACAARRPLAPPPAPPSAPTTASVAAEEPAPPPTTCDHLAAFSAAAVRAGLERATRLVDEAVAAGTDPLATQRAPLAQRLAQARAANAPQDAVAALERQLQALVDEHREAQHPRLRTYRDEEAERDLTRPYVRPDAWLGVTPPHELGLAPAPDPDEPPRYAQRTSPGATCVSTPRGAWSLVFDLVRPTPEGDLHGPWNFNGRLRLAYLANDAAAPALARIEPQHEALDGYEWIEQDLQRPEPDGLNCCLATGSEIAGPVLFDYDGDGEPELFLAASQSHEGTTHRWAALFTARGGRVLPYDRVPEGFRVDGLFDVNRDGRPDLLRQTEMPAGGGCGSGFPHSFWGPVFAAISRTDGSFDAQHADARAFAARTCPAPPSALDTPDAVVCARLWGRPQREVERVVRSRVAPWDCERENAGRPQRSRRASERYDEFTAALALPLPFTLR